MSGPVDVVLSALRSHDSKPRRSGDGWIARCPAHPDDKPSLSIGEGDDGRVLLHCFAGCKYDAVCSALGIAPAETFADRRMAPVSRPNRDQGSGVEGHTLRLSAEGNGVARNAPLSPPKGVPESAWVSLARREGSRWAIDERDATGKVIGTSYRAPDGSKLTKRGGKRGVILPWPLPPQAGTSAANPVFVCEGASDTATMLGLGFDVVGTAMAGHGGPMLAELLAGKHAVIIEDADEVGRSGAAEIVAALIAHCASVRKIEPPGGAKDARDAVISGADAAAFLALAKAAEPFSPTTTAPTRNDAAPTVPLFTPIAASQLIADHLDLRPVVIEGLLRQGEVMNVVAAPKTGKSWLIHSLAVAVVSEQQWLGKATTRGRVLLIDGELHRETLAQRLRTIQRKLGVSDADMAEIDVWLVRGQRLTIDSIEKSLRTLPSGEYRLIILDAMYRFLPLDGEENANETITGVYNTLDEIAKHTGASIAVVHHTTKGSQANKAVTDVGAGAGSQSRAADTHLILRPHEEDGAVVVDAAVRSFPPMDSFVIRSMKPGWALAPDLDPAKFAKPPRKSGSASVSTPAREPVRAWTPNDFAEEVVGRARLIRDDVIVRGVERGLGKAQAIALLKRALAAGLVHRHCDGPSKPHRFSTEPPAGLADGAGPGGSVRASSSPGADAPGGVGGTRATPLPPSSTPTDSNQDWGEL